MLIEQNRIQNTKLFPNSDLHNSGSIFVQIFWKGQKNLISIIFYLFNEFFTTGITILYICGMFVLSRILVTKNFSVATWYKYSPLANKSWGAPFSLFFVWCFPFLSPPVSSFRGALYHSVEWWVFFRKKPKGSVYGLFHRRAKTFKLTIFLRWKEKWKWNRFDRSTSQQFSRSSLSWWSVLFFFRKKNKRVI